MRLVSLLSLVLLVLVALSGGPHALLAEERAPIQPHFLMDDEPSERPQVVPMILNPKILPLWKLALSRPESELQRQVAEAICQAHEYGHDGLTDFIPPFVALLKQDTLHPATRYSVSRALIALDSRDSAQVLMESAEKDSKNLRMLVEPVLGAWHYPPIEGVWRERLERPETSRRDLILAINGLAQNQVTSAHAAILKIAISPTRPADIRLAAARGAGATADSGVESAARQLMAKSTASIIDRLCAVSLLVRHRSSESIELNLALAIDPEPTVAAEALRTLFASDPQHVIAVAPATLANPDANVRRVGIETYLKLPTVERLITLAGHLNDPHPELRSIVREGFLTHSTDSQWETVIRENSIRILAGDDWRGQEQCALLLATLDRKEIAPRLVELLTSEREEVMIATGWALKTIAVPETAPAINDHVSAWSKRMGGVHLAAGEHVAHLCEALGRFKYKPAVPVLRVFVPKTEQYDPIPRAAAVWALGQVFEDAGAAPPAEPSQPDSLLEKASKLLGGGKEQPDPVVAEELAAEFMARIRDVGSMPPEAPEVRRASALALGRMKSVSQIEGLKNMIGEFVDSEPVELAMRWAVLRISGEDLPIVLPPQDEHTGWFLEPTRPKAERAVPSTK